MPAPAASTNGKTIDISAFSDAFSKSFRIKCKVKFDDMSLGKQFSSIVPAKYELSNIGKPPNATGNAYQDL